MKKRYTFVYFGTVSSVITALLFTLTFNIYSFYENAKNDMERIGSSTLSQEKEKIEDNINKGIDVLNITAISIDHMMKINESDEAIENLLSDELQRLKSEVNEYTIGINGFFRGRFLDGSRWIPGNGYDATTRDWYNKAKEAKGKASLVSPYTDAISGNKILSISKLLYDRESVLCIDFLTEGIQNIIHEISLDGYGYGFLIDRQGTIIAHYNQLYNGRNFLKENNDMTKLVKEIITNDRTLIKSTIEGKESTVFTDKIFNDWIIVLIIPDSRLYRNLNSILARNITTASIIILLVTVFSILAYITLKKASKNEKQIQKRLEILNEHVVTALARTIDAKDRYTKGHSQRVAEYSAAIAKKMGKSKKEIEEIYYAGLLHDVGKIRVSENLINKTDKLNPEEMNQIKIHPVTGFHILKDIYEDNTVALGSKCHHERYDGKGYPLGLRGEEIPEIARIICVADTYDAMTSNRSYRKALPQETVKTELIQGKGTQFDPKIAEIMIQIMDEDKEYRLRENAEPSRNILIVDDEPMDAVIVRTILETDPLYTVTAAYTAEQTLELIAKCSFDLILLDLMMPDIDGFDLYELITRKCRIPVVILTGEINSESFNKGLQIGAKDYITKPIQPTILKETLHSIFNNIFEKQ